MKVGDKVLIEAEIVEIYEYGPNQKGVLVNVAGIKFDIRSNDKIRSLKVYEIGQILIDALKLKLDEEQSHVS